MILCTIFVVYVNNLKGCITKKARISFQKFLPLKRCLADSNRRRRFCRPLTKPLIQGTV